MSTLVYTAALPVSQAAGPAGTTIDKLIDLVGNQWSVSASKLSYGDDYLVNPGKWLVTPPSGTDPITGQPYAQSSQLLVFRMDAAKSDFSAVLHAHYTTATNEATYQGYVITFNPGTGVISSSIANGAGGYDFYASGGTVISSGLVICVLAIQQVSPTQVNVYADYRLASAPNVIVFAAGKLAITHANAIVQNSQVGFRGQVVTTSNIDQIAYYAYDGVITSPTGGTSGAATNLPTWGSDLTKPGTPAVAANGLGQAAASVSAAGATSSTGPVTYQWVKGSVGDAGSAMTPVAGQTSLSATIPLTAGAISAIRLKATDAFPSTPGVQYSNELPLRPYAGLDLVVATLGDSITGNPQTWTDTSQGGSLAGSTSLAAEIGNILPALLDRRTYIVNQGIAGAKTTDWRTDAPGGGGNYFNAAVAAYNAQCTAVGYVGTKYATVLLGANDAIQNITASAYQANLTNICAGLIAAGITPILVPPTWAADRTPTSNAIGSISQKALLVDYPAVLPAVVAAAPGTKLLSLPWLHSLFAANTTAWQTDGLHPSAEGVHQTAGAIARGIANLISPGGPSGFRGILTGGGM